MVVAALHGEIDLSNAAEIEGRLARSAPVDAPLIVDTSSLTYIDSSGFGMLERLSRKAQLRVVVPLDATVHRAFAVTALEQIFPVFETVAAALRDTGDT
jgi:anti-anti-sigma factor